MIDMRYINPVYLLTLWFFAPSTKCFNVVYAYTDSVVFQHLCD